MNQKKGILLINLGSPDSHHPRDVRSFLRVFLSDSRVIDFPQAIWKPILHGIVLRTRPKKSAKIYRSIWTEAGSPLVVYTKAQQKMVAEAFPDYLVKYAMTYTTPRIQRVLEEFEDAGVTDLTVIPLFPQYAPSAGGASITQVLNHYAQSENMPNLRVIGRFEAEPNYIDWYAKKIAEACTKAEAEGKPFDLIVHSYHGVPDRKVHRPVGYCAECEMTSSAIMARAANYGVKTASLTTFQSKFGPGEWLKPATIDTMAGLPSQGVKSVLVTTPGFIVDCIETVDEIGVLNRDAFLEAGGTNFVRVLPPNDDPVIVDIVRAILGK